MVDVFPVKLRKTWFVLVIGCLWEIDSSGHAGLRNGNTPEWLPCVTQTGLISLIMVLSFGINPEVESVKEMH